jgi:putative hemolysin
MRKKSNKTNIVLVVILIIIIIFFIVYLFVPFLNNSFLKKTFSPFCGIKKLYQGEKYLPAWCLEGDEQEELEKEDGDDNQNINTSANTNDSVGLANPAAVKCEEDGGTLEPFETAAGTDSLCVFSDKSICNEWTYFRGDCQPGGCIKECRAKGTKNEGWYNSCTGERIKLEICSQEDEEDTKLEDVKPVSVNIKITSPIADEQLSSPFKIEGQAKVSDNKVYIRVKNPAGSVLIEETSNAINKSGSEWADFDIEIAYEFNLTKQGVVEIYSLDQDDQEINLISLPVKF